MYFLDETLKDLESHHVCLINCVANNVRAQTVILINSVVVSCEATVVFMMGGAATTVIADVVTSIGAQKIGELHAKCARTIGVDIDRAAIMSGRLSSSSCTMLQGTPILENTRIGTVKYDSQTPPCIRTTEKGLNAFRQPYGIFSISATTVDLEGATIEEASSWTHLQEGKNYVMIDRDLALVQPTAALRIQDKSRARPHGTAETRLPDGSVRLLGTGRCVQLQPVFVGYTSATESTFSLDGKQWEVPSRALFCGESVMAVFDLPEHTNPFFGATVTAYVSISCRTTLKFEAFVGSACVGIYEETVPRSAGFSRIKFPRVAHGSMRDTSLTVTITAKELDNPDYSVGVLGLCANAYSMMLHDSPEGMVNRQF